MKTTIMDLSAWRNYYSLAGTTASEWVDQVLNRARGTDLKHSDVMRNLRIGGWNHSYHYGDDLGLFNTEHARDALRQEVVKLARELDERLHQLTAVENELLDLLREHETESSI